jgi:hypothetical protein
MAKRQHQIQVHLSSGIQVVTLLPLIQIDGVPRYRFAGPDGDGHWTIRRIGRVWVVKTPAREVACSETTMALAIGATWKGRVAS